MSTTVPINRFTKSPLTKLSVSTLRRWYWSGESEDFTDLHHPDLHRYAIVCELRNRRCPVDNWPQDNPFIHLTTQELRVMEAGRDQILTHAARNELIERGYSERQRTVGSSGQGCHLMSFAGC